MVIRKELTSAEYETPAHKCFNANNCFNIYEQEITFLAHLSLKNAGFLGAVISIYNFMISCIPFAQTVCATGARGNKDKSQLS